jgi:co-chaperonin GroES (HSP10)
MTAEDVICIYDIAANDYDCPSNIIIAAPVEEEERVGSLFRPMNFAERPVYARVIRAGKGRFATSGERIPNEVKAGDLIAYHSRVNGIHLSLPDGSKGVVMTEAEVLAGFRE